MVELNFNVPKFVCHCMDSIKDHGFIKSGSPDSTSVDTENRYLSGSEPATPESFYADLSSWASKIKAEKDSYLDRVKNIVTRTYISPERKNLLASAVGKYYEFLKEKEAAENSKWAGPVDSEVAFKIASLEVVKSYQGDFGPYYFCSIKDEEGLSYSANLSKPSKFSVGSYMKGTISTLYSYRGVKVTKLVHCKSDD